MADDLDSTTPSTNGGTTGRPIFARDDPSAPRDDPRTDVSLGPNTPAPRACGSDGAGERLAVVPPQKDTTDSGGVDGGPTGNGNGVPVRQVRQDMAGHHAIPATRRANDLALPEIPGLDPEAYLRAAGGAMLAVALQGINVAKRLMERCEADDDRVAVLASVKILEDATFRWYEHAHGRKVSTDIRIRSQEDLPRWEDLAPEVREAVERALTRASDPRD